MRGDGQMRDEDVLVPLLECRERGVAHVAPLGLFLRLDLAWWRELAPPPQRESAPERPRVAEPRHNPRGCLVSRARSTSVTGRRAGLA